MAGCMAGDGGLIAAVNDECVRHGAMFLAMTEDTGIQVWPDPAMREKFQKRLGVSDLFYPDRRIAALGQRDGLRGAHPRAAATAIRRGASTYFCMDSRTGRWDSDIGTRRDMRPRVI